ncbi:serine hydrolase [Desulfobacterales bacterium HSG17]|nr:serine hydrolase [Desulfobacterales bacterium HSG17]
MKIYKIKKFIYEIILLIILLTVPTIALGMASGIDANQIVGEYTLTKSSEHKLIQAGLNQQVDIYKTLYILQSVNGLEIEAQNSQQGGAPLIASTIDPYTFHCKVADAIIIMDIPDNAHATGLRVQMGDFRGIYQWENRGKSGVDSVDAVFQNKDPEMLGLNENKLSEADIKVSSGLLKNIHGIMVIKNGYIAFEKYYNGSNVNHIHQIRSAGKSITSIAIGIAIDQGYIPGVDQKVFDYFLKEAPPEGWDRKKQQLTIEHLLTMTSGIDCDDWQEPQFECGKKMLTSSDWGNFALTLPMAYEPGTHWAYNSTALMILSRVIRNTTGKRYQDFLKENLLGPIGIKNYTLLISPEEDGYTGGSAKMTARDMAKIGYLYLKKGNWFGKQIVSSSWVDQSTSSHVKSSNFFPYGYLWWKGKRTVNGVNIETYYAAGNGGQYIFIFPSLDMVVVFTGGNYNNKLQNQIYGLLSKYIINAATPQKTKLKVKIIAPEILDSYTGLYQNKNMQIVITKQKGGLYWINSNTSSKPVHIYPLSNSLFISPSQRYDHTLIKFQFDSQKKISGIGWHDFWRSVFLEKMAE